MRRLERRAYRWQADEMVEAGQFKEFPKEELIAVLPPEVKISGIRHQKYEAVSVYKRGEALHTILRRANKEEREEWKNLSRDDCERKGIIRIGGELWVRVIMKIEEGLAAGARQRIRHIPGNLIERKGDGFVLPGTATVLSAYAERINNIIKPLLETSAPSSRFLEKLSVEYLQLLSLSEKSKTQLMKSARRNCFGQTWQILGNGSA